MSPPENLYAGLPADIISLIARHLNVRSVLAISEVCTQWRNSLSDLDYRRAVEDEVVKPLFPFGRKPEYYTTWRQKALSIVTHDEPRVSSMDYLRDLKPAFYDIRYDEFLPPDFYMVCKPHYQFASGLRWYHNGFKVGDAFVNLKNDNTYPSDDFRVQNSILMSRWGLQMQLNVPETWNKVHHIRANGYPMEQAQYAMPYVRGNPHVLVCILCVTDMGSIMLGKYANSPGLQPDFSFTLEMVSPTYSRDDFLMVCGSDVFLLWKFHESPVRLEVIREGKRMVVHANDPRYPSNWNHMLICHKGQYRLISPQLFDIYDEKPNDLDKDYFATSEVGYQDAVYDNFLGMYNDGGGLIHVADLKDKSQMMVVDTLTEHMPDLAVAGIVNGELRIHKYTIEWLTKMFPYHHDSIFKRVFWTLIVFGPYYTVIRHNMSLDRDFWEEDVNEGDRIESPDSLARKQPGFQKWVKKNPRPANQPWVWEQLTQEEMDAPLYEGEPSCNGSCKKTGEKCT